MILRFALFIISLHFLSLTVSAQKQNCRTIHTGSFKLTAKGWGTTTIKRTAKIQTEINESLGCEIIYDIKWVDECTYELRPKKLIKGDPRIMGDGTYVIKNSIKEITPNAYIVQTSSNFSADILEIAIDITR